MTEAITTGVATGVTAGVAGGVTGGLVVDAVLALFVLGLAAASVLAGPVRVSVGAFIALGAAVAALWARLGAPDVALAEAVIGAGLTGALLIRHIGLTGEDGAGTGEGAGEDAGDETAADAEGRR